MGSVRVGRWFELVVFCGHGGPGLCSWFVCVVVRCQLAMVVMSLVVVDR